MKFLHLADLHLGKSLYGVSLIDNKDQEVWMERFLEKAAALMPDAIVLSGDIYDRSSPSGDAVALFDDMLTRLAKLEIPVLMVAGNHDSGQRLSFAGEILAKQNVYISGIPTEEICHVSLPEKEGSGEASEEVTFWLMPYIFPAAIAQKLGDDTIRDYETAVRALLKRQEIDFSKRNVLVCHQNVTAGGQEAERGGSESMVGGVGQIDYQVFDGFDYVALGHIHSSYSVGRPAVRYAGTPLCYHFDELKQPQKGPLLVELGPKGTEAKITPLSIAPLHPMREIRGAYEDIKTAEEAGSSRGEYLRIVITDRRVTPEISEYLRELFRQRDSIVMELVSDYRELSAVAADAPWHGRERKAMEEYFTELYRERKGQAEPGQKDLELFRFAADKTRKMDVTEKREDSLQADAEELLDFILAQEV
ncbi:MAG: exonuclease SbcCD subunit D [Lachnospiraceae bacterium]|nr:exonuclease SbcCD subunit D [Lachnospiraceae bacterium]